MECFALILQRTFIRCIVVSLTNPSSGVAELIRRRPVKTMSTDTDSVILTGMPLILLKCDFFPWRYVATCDFSVSIYKNVYSIYLMNSSSKRLKVNYDFELSNSCAIRMLSKSY